MVYFQCEICFETLKKKQAEQHYFRCKSAYNYSCLTCNQIFDKFTLKGHTSCITEDQKYKKEDAKKQFINKNNSSNGAKIIKGIELNSEENVEKIINLIDEKLLNKD